MRPPSPSILVAKIFQRVSLKVVLREPSATTKLNLSGNFFGQTSFKSAQNVDFSLLFIKKLPAPQNSFTKYGLYRILRELGKSNCPPPRKTSAHAADQNICRISQPGFG